MAKLHVDDEDIWADTVGHYKSSSLKLYRPIHVVFNGSPVMDTGGVRRQVFTDVFKHLLRNTSNCLIDQYAPLVNVSIQHSGLFCAILLSQMWLIQEVWRWLL